jgi:uncharacterized protein YbjT (DUF2867 family)
MKVFITGATGFVGQEIVRQLHERHYSIRLLTRQPETEEVRAVAAQYGAEVWAGNVLEAASLAGALDGMNAVIHLVGIISEYGENTFENVHEHGTENLAAAARQAGIERFVHMSALGARADAPARYHQSKWAAEEVVRQSDLDATIFRPSLIFGPRDRFVNLFAKIIRFSPVVPLLASEQARFQPVAVETVAAAFTRSVAEPKSIGQTFDLCGPETFTLRELVSEICAVMGRRRLRWRVPQRLAASQAGFLEFIYPRLFKKAPPLNHDQLIMLKESNTGNPQPANQLFGLTPIRFCDGIARYLAKKPELPAQAGPHTSIP